MSKLMDTAARTILALVIVFSAVAQVSSKASPDHQSSVSADPATEVLTLEKEIEAAVVRGDAAFLDKVCASDFVFVHGDGWTTGGAPLRTDDRAKWLAAVGKTPYLIRDLDSVKVELHGDVAITYGRYRAQFKAGAPNQRPFTVWFERVYARRNGHWEYLSHRTVNGPNYEGAPSAAK